MAGIARGGKACLHMVGIGCAVVILHVAGTAGAAGQVVISVDVTLRALQSCVCARERKSNCVVVKSCW